jgi:hypothetical protein
MRSAQLDVSVVVSPSPLSLSVLARMRVFCRFRQIYGKRGKELQGVFKILEDETSLEQFKPHSVALPECSWCSFVFESGMGQMTKKISLSRRTQ